MLLFWQALKNIFKEKIHITIFIILASLLTLLGTSAWIVNSRLSNAYNFMGEGTFTYDYLVSFNSKKTKTQNVQTISPWFAFNGDYHRIIDVRGDTHTLPYLGLGTNKALMSLDQNIDIKFTFNGARKVSNIIFTDTTNGALNFLNNGLYRFNKQSASFQKSLIGQLYDQNGILKNPDNSIKIEKFMDNFARSDISKNTISLISDYLNEKFAGTVDTGVLKNEILKFVNPVNAKTWIKDIDLNNAADLLLIPEYTDVKDTVYNNGMNGQLSFLMKNTTQQLVKISLYYSPNIDSNALVDFNNNIKDAVFTVNDFYNVNNLNQDFNNENYGPYHFTTAYYDLVGAVTNYTAQFREQYQYWDLTTGNKYKIINWQQLLKYDQLKILEKYPSFDPSNPLSDVYTVITPQYAKSKNLKVGDQLTLGQDSNFFVGAIGGDVANIYPTIYDTDVFPDTKFEAVVYVSPNTYRSSKIIPNSDIDEGATVFLIHDKTKKEEFNQDTANFKKYLATDFTKLASLANTNTPLQSRGETALVYTRYSLLGTATGIYRLVNIVLIVLFLIILSFTLSILVKKIINEQKIANGILKANGYSGSTIANSYLVYAIIVTLIGTPIGWIMGVILQFPIMHVFNTYFVIPSSALFSLWPLLIAFGSIGLVSSLAIFITAFRQLRCNPLELLNPNKNIKTSKFVVWIGTTFQFKKFSTKFRFIMMAVSTKKIGWFFLTFFVASLSLTLASLIPTVINKLSKDYYSNLAYNNEYSYSNVVGNIPFSRYEMYDWNGPNGSNMPSYPLEKNSLVSDYLYVNTLNKWLSTTKDINANNANIYANRLNQMIIYNFMVGKGASFSIGTFYDIYKRYGENTSIRNQIDSLLCTALPAAFNKKPVIPNDPNIIDRWTYCTQYATSDILPSKIKALWTKNKLAKEQFNVTFGTSTYNKKNEDVYTGYNIAINDSGNDISTYGINKNNKTIIFPNEKYKNKLDNSSKLDFTKTEIPIVINQTTQLKNAMNIGDVFKGKTAVSKLQFCENSNGSCDIENTAWRYAVPTGYNNDNIDPFTIDLTKLSIATTERFGFENDTAQVQDYYNVANFELRIPQSSFSSKEIQVYQNSTVSATTGNTLIGLLNVGSPVVTLENGFYVIKPFDTTIDKGISGIGDIVSGFPTNWYQEAFRQGLLKMGTKEKTVEYVVVGIQDSYDSPRAYVNQEIANKILGYNNSQSTLYLKNDENPLLWFNGKFSKYADQVDQTTRYNFSSQNGSYTMSDFIGGNLSPGVGTTDYLIIKTEVIQKLAIISSILSVIFVIITIITSVIIIYIMTQSFVNGFLKFIAVMKALGYSNWEINSLTLGIFSPFALIAWGLGIGIMWAVLKVGVYSFSKVAAVIIPVGFPWIIVPITFALVAGIYALTYWIATYKIKHMSIQEQVNANEV